MTGFSIRGGTFGHLILTTRSLAAMTQHLNGATAILFLSQRIPTSAMIPPERSVMLKIERKPRKSCSKLESSGSLR
jgi:hypothetical protein